MKIKVLLKYGTLHKKLCELSRATLLAFAGAASRIGFATFTNTWRTILGDMKLHYTVRTHHLHNGFMVNIVNSKAHKKASLIDCIAVYGIWSITSNHSKVSI